MTTYLAISTPIVKPVNGSCNLSCSYCYASGLRKQTRKNRMHPETLKATIDFFCRDQGDIEFIWHGGEPLLAGIDFYRKAVGYQQTWEQKGKKIINSIQTNATLISSEWTKFFAKHDFSVGVSLDGPKNFHDQVRHYSDKTGSYDNVMRGIKLLRQAGIFGGIICCISAINYQFPKEVFSFFISQDIKKLKFARVKNIGHCNDISSLTVSPKQYIDFMIAIFNLWLYLDDPEVEIRDIQSVVGLIIGGNECECIYMGECDQFVTVYQDGSIYGCNSFPKTNALSFGNVINDSDLVRSSPCLKSFQETLRKRRTNCQTCNWDFICKGGCAKDCYAQLDSTKPIGEVCKNLKRYFGYISGKIRSYGLT